MTPRGTPPRVSALEAAPAVYGWVAHAFIEWLVANSATARSKLLEYKRLWDSVSAKALPPNASGQARRVADRLGAIACAGALAAEVLNFPWGFEKPAKTDDAGNVIKNKVVVSAAWAALLAGDSMLKAWLDTIGGGTQSSAVNELARKLKEHVEIDDRHFGDVDTNGLHPSFKSTLHHYGWKVSSPRASVSYSNLPIGAPPPPPPTLEYIDILTDVVRVQWGFGKSKTKSLMPAIDKAGWLVKSRGYLTYQRRGTTGRVQVYRILADFFMKGLP